MYDIIYVSDKKDSQYQKLKSKYPLIKIANDVESAQRICLTNFYWLVFDDLLINGEFNFDYIPDKWSQDYVHVFKNDQTFDGVALVPKNRNISQHELDYRFFVNRKEVELCASTPKPYDLFYIDTYNDYLNALENTTTEMFWMSSANIKHNCNLVQTFYISHHESQLRKQNHAFITEFGAYNGLFLCSKHTKLSLREIEHRFLVNRIEHDTVGSTRTDYDFFEIDSYQQYLDAFDNSKTEMFWMSSANIKADIPDLYFPHDNEYDRKTNHNFLHCGDKRNGLFLCSKHVPLTQKEIEHRFLVNAKEWNIEASGPVKYDIFYPKTYEDYLHALETSKTEMFWIIPEYVNPTDRFKFDTYFTHDETYERQINHAYLNGKYHDGIVLCSKAAKFSRREFDYKFIANKKEVNIVLSTPKPYDIVFISYKEPNADKNYERLLQKFPRAKRIHGVKGIHQAHIEGAKLCNTEMFWIVDGDAVVLDDFKFDYQCAQWDRDTVHVWRSMNPINDLIYGYGGVKLFPTQKTINMDLSKPDMTTSISDKFRAVGELSVITGFNTGEFETWKSAFRECCKLSSRVIDRQNTAETQERLNIWTSVGAERKYGEYAIAGAKAGKAYGEENKKNIEALRLINDFDWLEERFNATT